MLTRYYSLNMDAGAQTEKIDIKVGQYDTAVTLRFRLCSSSGTDFAIPDGTTAMIRGTKKDGRGIIKAVTLEDNFVTVPLDAQMTAAAGLAKFELVLTNGDSILTSRYFYLNVIESAITEDTDLEEVDIPDFALIIQEIGELLDSVDTILSTAEEVEQNKTDITAMIADYEASAESHLAAMQSTSEDVQDTYDAAVAVAGQISTETTASLASIESAKDAALDDIENNFVALTDEEINAILV